MTPALKHVRPHDVGWRLGQAGRSGPELWVPFDRTTCVIGPQGSGKTLDLLVPALLAVELDPGYADDGQRLLEDWDLTQPAEGTGAAAAAYLNATWRELLALTFHDELPAPVWPDGGARWVEVVAALLESPRDPWWDDVTTDRVEDRDDVLRRAMLEARDELTRRQAREADRWTWGHVHQLFLASPGLAGPSASAF